MRKFVLWLMLLTLIFTAPAFAAGSGALIGFGLHRSYNTNGSLIVTTSGTANYSNITQYESSNGYNWDSSFPYAVYLAGII